MIKSGASKILEEYENLVCSETVAFLPPKESLEKSLENLNESHSGSPKLENVEEESENEDGEEKNVENHNELANDGGSQKQKENWYSAEKVKLDEPSASCETKSSPVKSESEKVEVTSETIEDIKHLSVTDEEKEQRLALEGPLPSETDDDVAEHESLSNKPFLETILNSLYCTENDYAALFALCLTYALSSNQVLKFFSRNINLLLIGRI